MEVIKPREISGKILTLVDEATDVVTIVTPYLNIAKWTKVNEALSRAKRRGVRITFFLRADQAGAAWMAEPHANEIHMVDRLHAKLYMNSKAAVFTSMNLVRASDDRSTDLGIYTEDPGVLASFHDFIESYLMPNLLEESVTRMSARSTEGQFTGQRSSSDHVGVGSALRHAVPDGGWGDRKSYWFSNKAAPLGDLMISDSFIWKLNKSVDGQLEAGIRFARVVEAQFGDWVNVTIENDHEQHLYVKCTPADVRDLPKTMVRLVNVLRSNL